jgi:peptidoglycan glycosyltransferase
MRANLRRAAFALLSGFLVIALALGYWQVFRAADLGASPSNPRVADARLTEARGRILDRVGQVLATTEQTPDGPRRRYPDPSLVHTIGFHSARFGDTNLEARYDAELRGERSPSPLERLQGELLHKGPRTNDLLLTIDKRVHDAAIAALGDARGAIVALDPRSGAVLAMASKPFFDPNASDDQLGKLQDDPAQPLYNRAIQATYVPGSTFKTVTASAAIDLGLVDLTQPFTCTTAVRVGAYAVDCRNSQHVPRLTYKEAFAWSSNRVFGLSGLLLGFPGPMNPWLDDRPPGPYPWTRPGASIAESAARLEDYARRFGFERSLPFDLPVTPSQVKRPSSEWTPELLVQTAFGQGEIEATPLQMALVAAAVANNGRVPVPYVASELRSDGASRSLHTAGETFSTAMSSGTAQTMVSFFVEGTVRGYAENAAIPRVQVGGKTGTAEIGDGSSHSWFIGFAPADAPRVAVAVIMERKGSGSDFATPAARRVLQAALDATNGTQGPAR